MCRKSKANKYRKCYLKKPRLSTIPEESDDGKSLRVSIRLPKHLSAQSNTPTSSPKGIKRILNNTYSGNRSPRCNTKLVKNKDLNVMVTEVTCSKNQLLLVTDADIGRHSPQCRRSTKRSNKENVPHGGLLLTKKVENSILDLNDQILSASPRTAKRILDTNNNNLGNHSPQCRRAVNKDNMNKVRLSVNESNSPRAARTLIVEEIGQDVGGKSPTCRRTIKGSQSPDTRGKKDETTKQKGFFKRMVKYLTVPQQEDFLNS